MAQTPKLRTHTDFDLEHLEELQHVVDRVLLPNSFRKRQAMNMGVGVMAAVIGAVCAGLTGQLWVGVVFAVLGAVFFLWGVFLYRIAAWQALRGLDPRTKAADYVLEKAYLWAVNGTGDFHHRYEDCAGLVETEHSLYFLLQSGEAIVLDKRNLQGGGPQDLRDWLVGKCGRPILRLGPDWKIAETSNQEK